MLFDHAVRIGAALGGTDPEEVVAELLALSGRRREALEEALDRIRFLHPGDDVTRAEALLRAAIRRGDAAEFWRIELP